MSYLKYVILQCVNIDLSQCDSGVKGCIKMPSGCTGVDCQAVGMWQNKDGPNIAFELATTDQWVTLGVSADQSMVCCLRVFMLYSVLVITEYNKYVPCTFNKSMGLW